MLLIRLPWLRRVIVGLHVTGISLLVLISIAALHVVLHVLANSRASLRLVSQDTRQLPAVPCGYPVRVYLSLVRPRTQRLCVLLVGGSAHTWRVVLTGLHDLMLGGCRPILAVREGSNTEAWLTILRQRCVAITLPGLLESPVYEHLLCCRLYVS